MLKYVVTIVCIQFLLDGFHQLFITALFGSGDVGLGRYPASTTLDMTVLQEMRDLVAVPGMNHEVDAVGVLMDIFY